MFERVATRAAGGVADAADDAGVADAGWAAFVVDATSPAPDFNPASEEPSGWTALDLDVSTAEPAELDDAALVDGIVAFERAAAWAGARQARLLAEFARRRPGDDPGAGLSDTASAISRYAPDEIGLALRLSRLSATYRLAHAVVLDRLLTDTRALWESGSIDAVTVRTLCDAVVVLDEERALRVQARVLPRAGQQTPAQFRASVARAVAAVDPDGAARRHEQAKKGRRVVLGAEADGMATLWALLSAPDAASCYQWLTRLAHASGAHDPRPIDARRADLLTDLLTGRLTAIDDTAGDATTHGTTTDGATTDGATTAAPTRTGAGRAGRAGADTGRSGTDGLDTGGPDTSGAGPHGAGDGAGDGADAGGADAHGADAHGTRAYGTGAHETDAHRADERGTRAHGTGAHKTRVHGVDDRAVDTDGAGTEVRGARGASAEEAAAAEAAGRVIGAPAAAGDGPVGGSAGSASAGPVGEASDRLAPAAGSPARRTDSQQDPSRSGTGGTGRTGGSRTPPAPPGKPLIHIVMDHSTLIGADDQPAHLVGYGPIPAPLAREIAADGVWRRLVTDPLSGTLLDVGRTTYRPPQALADFVRTRDVECRSPICRRRALDAELDHNLAWADGGTTSSTNLWAGCPHHHHLKHSPGWTVRLHADASMTWTTPTGHSYRSGPHDYRCEPSRPPPSRWADPARTDTQDQRGSAAAPSTHEDPPPF